MTLHPGSAAICRGTVRHRRSGSVGHVFEQPLAMVWIDPDRPAQLFGRHPLWSARWPAPVRFRRSDHGPAGDDRPLGDLARDELDAELGHRPTGPVRLLTQPRMWGWLFNPISVTLAWDDPEDDPVGLVAEVTNTPWHERHRYAVGLERVGGELVATFDKQMHVSPFLPLEGDYRVAVRSSGHHVELDVVFTSDAAGPHGPETLAATLVLDRTAPTRRMMRRTLVSPWLPTHRVTASIRRHAYRLWRKGAQIHAHPSRA